MALAALNTHAATLAQYAFTSASTAATSSHSDVTAGTFASGSGIGSAVGGFSSSGNIYTRTTGTYGSGDGYPSFTQAKANNDYFTVTITPNAGFEMNLTSFEFDYGYNSLATYTTGSNTLRAYITTSFDNHATFFDGNTNGYVSITNPTINSTNYPTSKSLNLSGTPYQNISTAVEFRIYLSDTYHKQELLHRIDNVTLKGSLAAVAVPEPSSSALLGLGFSTILLRRRK